VGSDVIYVSRMPWVIVNDFFLYRNRPGIDLREARALEARLRGVALVNPSLQAREDVKRGSETLEDVPIIGTTEKQSQMSSVQPQSGRFLMPYDLASRKSVCVIGSDIRDKLFKGVDPIHRTLKLGRNEFRVIGVMEKQGGSFLGGPNFDQQVYVPITSFVRTFGGRRGHMDVNVAVKAPSQEAMADLEYVVIGEMRKVRGLRPVQPDNFSIN
jgi:putative ABC transport system permease protein